MWVYLSNSFLSFVEHRDDPTKLMVRARSKWDIPRVFPHAKVSRTPKADYTYRAVIDRAEVQQKMLTLISDINYDNFKGSVKEQARHDAYLECWSAMSRFQRKHGKSAAETVLPSLPVRSDMLAEAGMPTSGVKLDVDPEGCVRNKRSTR